MHNMQSRSDRYVILSEHALQEKLCNACVVELCGSVQEHQPKDPSTELYTLPRLGFRPCTYTPRETFLIRDHDRMMRWM